MKKRPVIRWLILFLYVALIYSTLGFAPQIAKIMREAGCLGMLTSFLIVLGAGAVLWIGFTCTQSIRSVAGIALVILLISLILDFPEERLHLLEYGVVGWLCAWSVSGQFSFSKAWPLAVILSMLLGIGDEIIQLFLTSRVYDERDILLNFYSSMNGLALFILCHKRSTI